MCSPLFQYLHRFRSLTGKLEIDRWEQLLQDSRGGSGEESVDPREAVAGIGGRLLAAYGRLPDGLASLHDERLGIGQLVAMRATLQRGRPTLVHPRGLITALASPEPEAELRQDAFAPGLLEEDLAAFSVANLLGLGEEADRPPPTVSELPHHEATLRFCMGVAYIEAVPHLHPGSSRRDLFRRGQFCLYSARQMRTRRLLEALAAAEDPWIGTAAPRSRSEGDDRGSQPSRPAAGGQPRRPSPDRLAGIVLALRDHKRTLFADLAGEGSVRQVAIPKDAGVMPSIEALKVGDHLAVQGKSERSRSGEPTLFVEQVEWLRSPRLPRLRPAPSRLRAQASVLETLRRQLGELGFLEQCTPTLSDAYEGGTARPYETWVNHRSRLAYLRVTSEIALIKSLAHGLRRCYEIGSSFRNESHAGSLTGHHEFLLGEAYATDMSLGEMTDLIVELVSRSVMGDAWDRCSTTTISFAEAVSTVAGVEAEDEHGVRGVLEREADPYTATCSFAQALQILLDEVLAPAFDGVLVITEPPLPASPLTAGDEAAAARRWIYVDGVDCAEVARNEGDVDVLAHDLARQQAEDAFCVPRDYTDFLRAIAALPSPVVGVGIGVSRLVDLRDGVRAPCHVL
jgi:lysyl-tRNA synthetase class II